MLPPTAFSRLMDLRRRVKASLRPADSSSPWHRMPDVLRRTWDLGFTAFGGPGVHFHILHARFVEGKDGKEPWVDEQTYQELFAICQALPGPASTKMLFCLALLHAGLIPALMALLFWSLPGALGMYALAAGVQRIDEKLPLPVYALLSGSNAATVGLIALAAVQLAEKTIKDRISRLLIIASACAGMCYSALWYYPVLIVIGGLVTMIWDGGLSRLILRAKLRLKRRNRESHGQVMDTESIPLENRAQLSSTVDSAARPRKQVQLPETQPAPSGTSETSQEQSSTHYAIRPRIGLAVVALFFASFAVIMAVRGSLDTPPLPLDLFANMYLAGTIIFGGGPVVIPLLRSYVVDPGWVTSRDFLIGVAIIQAFPGPNFNMAVFLGALALRNRSNVLGGFLGYLGIFAPGIILSVAFNSFWRVLRRRKWVVNLLRGVNASAVGLVFTAVYRLWQIGYLVPEATRGQSLAAEPWWVVVATVSYASCAWFGFLPPVAIVFGAVLGLCWYGATQT
ncbi:hypothetical protein VTN31DRAFT_2370 [Thermomyces dupontii]|uniref:uncharacterized protein n=1 Tax=Talaromyces thermophilus TaxID=28565 RepID=UPI003744A529